MGKRRARIAAALWGGFLSLITSWPNPPSVPAGGLPLDKVTHSFLYAIQAFLLSLAIAWEGRPGFYWSRILAIVGTMTLWGALDEAHQEWIPGRMMDSGDLFVDVAGATVGALFAAAMAREGRTEA